MDSVGVQGDTTVEKNTEVFLCRQRDFNIILSRSGDG